MRHERYLTFVRMKEHVNNTACVTFVKFAGQCYRFKIQDSRDFIYPEGNWCATVMEQGGKYKIK